MEAATAKRLLAALALALVPTLVAAQAAIYESAEKGVPVYSDLPSAGAHALDLPPINTLDQAAPVPPPSPPESAAAPYNSLRIASPTDAGTIHTNTGAFDVQATVLPAWSNARGDSIIVRLDGKQLTRGFGQTSIHLSADDWARAARADRVEHLLQLAIIDRDGTVLIESAPVSFYAHRAVRRARAGH